MKSKPEDVAADAIQDLAIKDAGVWKLTVENMALSHDSIAAVVRVAIDTELATAKEREKKILKLIENACLQPADREVPPSLMFGEYDGDGNFVPPEKLPNIPALIKSSEIFEKNSADACVLYEELTAISENEAVPESVRNSAVRAVSGVTRIKLCDLLRKHVQENTKEAEKWQAEADKSHEPRRREAVLHWMTMAQYRADGVQIVIDRLEGKTWK
jgi:hypothetical protein